MVKPTILDAHGKHAQAVVFSEKHRLLVSAGMDAKIHCWSLPGWEHVASIEGHEKSVNSLSFSSTHDQLASGSSDQTVRVWSFPGGELLRSLNRQVRARFSPNGKNLATIGINGRVSLWDVDAYASPETLPVLDKRTFDLAFSPDGTWLVIAGTGSLHVYNLQESSLASSIVCHKFAVASVNFTQDGNHLVATGAEGALSIWNSSTWDERQRIQLPAKGVLQTALAPDSSTVYVSMDHRIAGYALDDGRTTMEIELPIKGVYGLAVSPDGVWLANAAADGKIRVWEL